MKPFTPCRTNFLHALVRRAPRRGLLGVSLAIVATVASLACNAHDLKPVERQVLVEDVGISIPIPPPSLTSEPVQQAEIEGQVSGLSGDEALDDVEVILRELRSGTELVAAAASDGSFDFGTLEVDFSDNCFEIAPRYDDGSG